MICNLALNQWDLEESPDSKANLLFLTSTVYESLREMKEDGDCKVQGENFESAKTRFLVALVNFKTRVVFLMYCDYSCIGLDGETSCVQTAFGSETSVGIVRVPLLYSNRNCGDSFLHHGELQSLHPYVCCQNSAGAMATFQNLKG